MKLTIFAATGGIGRQALEISSRAQLQNALLTPAPNSASASA